MTQTTQELEFEEAVLGACLIDKEAFNQASSILKPEHFNNQDHQQIWSAFEKLTKDNTPIDLLSVGKYFKNLFILSSLTAKVSSSAHMEYWAAAIYEKYIRRQIVDTCLYGLNQADECVDIFDLQAQLLSRLENKASLKSKDPIPFGVIAAQTIKKIEDIQLSDKHITGIDTGLRDVNEITNGWHAPDLNIIAARPGVGKTAFALNIAINVAKQKIPIAFFTLEMSGMQLAYRAISIMSGVYSNYLKKAQLNDNNWKDIMNTNYNLPIYIDETPSLNILEFKDKVRKLKRKHNIEMVVVDYLQLMTAKVDKGNREQEVSTISRTLKHIAKELNVPVIALAQLSRDVEKRNGVPRLSDLRESGAIEQDADNIVFLHDENPSVMESNIQLQAIWAKHRNGSLGKVILNFDKGKQLFTNL